MSFMIKNDDMLEKYNEIWDQVKRTLNINVHSIAVYDEKYIKARLREFNGVIKTFHLAFWCPHVTYRMSCHASGHLVIYRECYGFEKAFLLSGIFYLTLLPAGFKASVGASSSTTKLAGPHADL